jgi:hypothetical protein
MSWLGHVGCERWMVNWFPDELPLVNEKSGLTVMAGDGRSETDLKTTQGGKVENRVRRV